MIRALLREQQEKELTPKEEFEASPTLKQLDVRAREGVVIDGLRFVAYTHFLIDDLYPVRVKVYVRWNRGSSLFHPREWHRAIRKIDWLETFTTKESVFTYPYAGNTKIVANREFFFDSIDKWEEAVRAFLAAGSS